MTFSATDRTQKTSIDWAARLLAGLCLTNLNEVTYRIFGIGQAFSILMLIPSVFLIAKCGREARSPAFTLLLWLFGSYITLGTLIIDPKNGVESDLRYQLTYAASVLVIWAIAGYVASLRNGPPLYGFFTFCRNALLVSTLSVWATPLLLGIYMHAVEDAAERMGGFFGNSNEAAHASLFTFVICLLRPFGWRWLQTIALFAAGGAVALTFSKAGMTILVVTIAVVLARRISGIALVALPMVAALLILVVQDLNGILQSLMDQHAFELSPNQKNRILQVKQILSGEASDEVTTGRNIVWLVGFERAWSAFPFGSGLGSYHQLVGGLMVDGKWQGAHNVYLMLWGEGGVIPMLFLFAMFATLFAQASRINSRELRFYVLLLSSLVAAYFMSGHDCLGVRYANIVLAIILGTLAASKNVNWQTRHRLAAAHMNRVRPRG